MSAGRSIAWGLLLSACAAPSIAEVEDVSVVEVTVQSSQASARPAPVTSSGASEPDASARSEIDETPVPRDDPDDQHELDEQTKRRLIRQLEEARRDANKSKPRPVGPAPTCKASDPLCDVAPTTRKR